MKEVSKAKIKEVENLKGLLMQDICIGIVDLTNLPSAQFQKLRNKLRDQLNIRVTKKSLIKIAIENIKDSKKDIEKLEAYLENTIPALLFTKEDPFKLAKTISKNKSNLPAKSGQIAPKNITIQAGPTKFSPGPIISELGAAGIKAAIEAGKVVIKQDVTIVKEGELITQKQADLLAKFGIHPMEIGLKIVALYKDGEIYENKVLFISEEEYINTIKSIVREAINLSVYISYPAKETIKLILQKAERERLSLENKVDLNKHTKPNKKDIKKVEDMPQEQEKNEENKETKPKSSKKQEKQLKNPVEYTEEASEKAQKIIDEMKDNA